MTSTSDAVALKIALATRGVRVDEPLRARLAGDAAHAPRALDLLLPDDVRVRAPIAESGAYALRAENGRMVIADDTAAPVEVRADAAPAFYGRRTASGRPMWQVATAHGTHLLLGPSGTCGFSTRGAPCPFCREGARPPGERENAASVADVVEVVRAAFEEGAADFVLFNTSAYDAEDGGIGFLAPYIQAVRRHFDTFVAVQVHPPRTNAWIDRSYAMGVDAISYNLELFDPETLGRHCIGRVRYIGRERYLEALAHAAGIFPSGTVWSDLVLGLEPAEASMAGIDALTAAGVVPVLSVHHPGADGIARLTAEEAAAVVAHLATTSRDTKLTVTWIRDLALGITPSEAGRMTGAPWATTTALQTLARSRLGAYAARGVARFRRRLRVRAIGDSLESSHL